MEKSIQELAAAGLMPQCNGAQQHSKPNLKAEAWIWEKMISIYGEKWIKERGETPNPMWSMEISKLSQTEIKSGVARCVEERLEWPPNLPKFLELCTRVDSSDAFWRMIHQKAYQSEAELVTRTRVGHQCRTIYTEEKARKVFEREYSLNVQRERRGELAQPVPALPEKSVVTEMEKRITDRMKKGPMTDIERRMAKIKAER